MPSINRDEFHQKSFRIKPDDDRIFSKLLTRQPSKSSFRVYYGDVSSSVPFNWETRPGTPKHSSAGDFQIPPLTPPPSYYTNSLDRSSKSSSRSMMLLYNLLRRMHPKRSASAAAVSHSSSSSLSSLSWSSSSHSSFSDPLSTPAYVRSKRRRFSSWGSSFDETAAADHDRGGDGVCPSRLCFGIGGGGQKARGGGGGSALIVKKALLSIVGRGSAA